jgi:hypothetical protein
MIDNAKDSTDVPSTHDVPTADTDSQASHPEVQGAEVTHPFVSVAEAIGLADIIAEFDAAMEARFAAEKAAGTT